MDFFCHFCPPSRLFTWLFLSCSLLRVVVNCSLHEICAAAQQYRRGLSYATQGHKEISLRGQKRQSRPMLPLFSLFPPVAPRQSTGAQGRAGAELSNKEFIFIWVLMLIPCFSLSLSLARSRRAPNVDADAILVSLPCRADSGHE